MSALWRAINATKVGGKTARPGLYMCNSCRSQFTVTVGTIFEDSKIPLNKWLLRLSPPERRQEGALG